MIISVKFIRIAFSLKSNLFNNTYPVIFLNKRSQLNNAFFPIINDVVNRMFANSKIAKNEEQNNPGNTKRKRDSSEDIRETR